MPAEVGSSLHTMDNLDRQADSLASHLVVKTADKSRLLETVDVRLQLERVVEVLSSEIEILNVERKIQSRVRTQIEKSQKEYYLNEQMKAIQKELRQKDDFAKEVQEIQQKIKEAKMTKETTEAAKKESARLEKMMPYSPEATVVRTYLDWLISLPWSVRSKDNLDVEQAEKC